MTPEEMAKLKEAYLALVLAMRKISKDMALIVDATIEIATNINKRVMPPLLYYMRRRYISDLRKRRGIWIKPP